MRDLAWAVLVLLAALAVWGGFARLAAQPERPAARSDSVTYYDLEPILWQPFVPRRDFP